MYVAHETLCRWKLIGGTYGHSKQNSISTHIDKAESTSFIDNDNDSDDGDVVPYIFDAGNDTKPSRLEASSVIMLPLVVRTNTEHAQVQSDRMSLWIFRARLSSDAILAGKLCSEHTRTHNSTGC